MSTAISRILYKVHSALTANELTRGPQRRLARKVKAAFNVPDAYGEIVKICRLLPPAAILDVGSHRGGTIVRYLDELESIPVHGFEPTPESFQYLQQRFCGSNQVTLHNVALSNESGVRDFFCNVNEQTNSLLDNDAEHQESFGEDSTHVRRIEVRTITLDGWAAKEVPEGRLVLKADVQGAEGLLIEGGRETIRERVIAFYSEVLLSRMYNGQADFGAVHECLTTELGFVLRDIYACVHDQSGQAAYADALWVKPEVLQALRSRHS
jgi:FkbM family methyltransferase